MFFAVSDGLTSVAERLTVVVPLVQLLQGDHDLFRHPRTVGVARVEARGHRVVELDQAGDGVRVGRA